MEKKMKRLFTGLAAAGLLALACNAVSSSHMLQLAYGSTSTPTQTATATLAPSATALPTRTPKPTNTNTPIPTDTETPIPTDTATATPDPLLAPLQEAVGSDYWQKMGLPDDLKTKYEALAQGQAVLADDEQAVFQDFIAQWEKIEDRLETYTPAADIVPGIRVRRLVGGRLVLYAVDEKATQAEGAERLILVAHPDPTKTKMLVTAPKLDGLTQVISDDGEFVEYTDANGAVVSSVDALPVISQKDETLATSVKDNSDQAYLQASQYPRFHFGDSGAEEAGFFAVEKTLTEPQMIMLDEALKLFDRPELQALKPYVFDPKIKYIFIKGTQQYAGMELDGIVKLNGWNLFQDKALLVGVIAHEAAHVIQQDKFDYCRAEIADGTIPSDLMSWSVQQLVDAVKSNTIGTTQLELWVDTKLGANSDIITWLKNLILTKGQGSWAYCNGTNVAP